MSMTITPDKIRLDATGLCVLTALPDRAVLWEVVGMATIEPLSSYTDPQGRAYAKVIPDPGSDGTTITVRATYGA